MIIADSLSHAHAPVPGACVAIGLFDGLHLGHAAVIRQAVACAERRGLVPAVFTFTVDGVAPVSKTGATTLLPDTLRFRLLEELGVQFVLRPPFSSFRGLSPLDFVESILHRLLHATYIYCGENFHFGKGGAAGVATLQEIASDFGITICKAPMVEMEGEPVSSTRIRACVARGDIPAANRMLGRPFTIDFPVIHGSRIGRTLDFPTINQPFPQGFTIPRRGVYASIAYTGGVWRSAVTNVGIKPTVGSDHELAETYIQGFEGDLYGQAVEVRFLEFLRPEQKFSTLGELQNRIREDAQQAKALCAPYIEAGK